MSNSNTQSPNINNPIVNLPIWNLEKHISFHAETTMEQNQFMRDELASFGDDGRSPRNIIHTAYKVDEIALSSDDILAYLEVKYSMSVSYNDQEDIILFDHETEVASQDFDDFVDRLKEDLVSNGWLHESWYTPIVDEKMN